MASINFIQIKGFWFHLSLQFAIWLSSFGFVLSLQTPANTSRVSSVSLQPSPPKNGIFDPIQVSPNVIPNYSLPVGSLPPMYPTSPVTYDLVLTGRCPVNFSAISSIMEITASDCDLLLAQVVGNVICCPQFSSLLRIFQGFYRINSNKLVLQNGVADDCFKDIISILASSGANRSIPTICPVKSYNLASGSCAVRDVTSFEKIVNSSKLLEAFSTIDPLKECCRPVCQPAIMEAAVAISRMQTFMNDSKVVGMSSVDMLNDCRGVVYSYISRKLSQDSANTTFRILSACKANKACPLDLKQPSEVIAQCQNVAAPSPSCCSSLNTYVAGLQKQMLITNRQAIMCAIALGSMLRKGGVMSNIYEICDVDLKDFSLQGCLLPSLPTNMVYDNTSGLSSTCDLRNNIAAPWPSSSSVTSLSLCAPEMSLPALPTSQTLRNHGCCRCVVDLFYTFFLVVVFVAVLYWTDLVDMEAYGLLTMWAVYYIPLSLSLSLSNCKKYVLFLECPNIQFGFSVSLSYIPLVSHSHFNCKHLGAYEYAKNSNRKQLATYCEWATEWNTKNGTEDNVAQISQSYPILGRIWNNKYYSLCPVVIVPFNFGMELRNFI